MDQDLQKIKPYINNLKRHLQTLRPDLQHMVKESLNDKLITMTSELDKLELVNNYCYILNSLLFAYMKLLGCKNLDKTIMIELNRCKEYMQRAKNIQMKRIKNESHNIDKQTKLKSSIVASLKQEPAISKENFQNTTPNDDNNNNNDNKQKNKHIKFKDNESERELLVEKINSTQKKKKVNSKNRVNK